MGVGGVASHPDCLHQRLQESSGRLVWSILRQASACVSCYCISVLKAVKSLVGGYHWTPHEMWCYVEVVQTLSFVYSDRICQTIPGVHRPPSSICSVSWQSLSPLEKILYYTDLDSTAQVFSSCTKLHFKAGVCADESVWLLINIPLQQLPLHLPLQRSRMQL